VMNWSLEKEKAELVVLMWMESRALVDAYT
jgi:hypothetical protein